MSLERLPTKCGLSISTLGHPPSVRANLEVDITQLEWDPFRLNILPHSLELSHIRFLGLGGLDLQDQDSRHIVQQLKRFTSIEEVTIVSPPPPANPITKHRSQPGVRSGRKFEWRRLGAELAYARRY